MLLRRIIAHFRKQEWTAVGIDFVIVVLGVFIATQVAEWSAAQADRRRGEAYVERLIGDLEVDLQSRRAAVAYYDAVYQSAERANALLTSPSPDPRALVISAYRATEYSYNPPTRATWDEIVSSGDLALIPRSAVENGLAEYFSIDTALNVRSALRESEYRHLVRSTLPHEVQNAIREGCSDVRDANGRITGFREDCTLGVSDAAIAEAARALRQNPAILSELRYQFSDVRSARANLRGDVTFLEGALAALRAE
ncbi:MAG: hypothetical protein AB7H66_00765 [Hyphomonadaceae bacterium]